MKKCSKCKKWKNENEFYKQKECKNGIRPDCKECSLLRRKNYCHSKKGLINRIYNAQRKSSEDRSHPMPDYSLKQLRDWALSQKKFHDLHRAWDESEHNKWMTPSFDRINDYEPYTLANLQIVTWKENCQKGHDDARNGINNKSSRAVIATHKETGKQTRFYSGMNARRETGVSQASINSCCSKAKLKNSLGCIYTRKSAGGYTWRYANP